MSHNGSHHKGGETTKHHDNLMRGSLIARASARREKRLSNYRARMELRRQRRTCPHCGTVGQSAGRFRRRHLHLKLCQRKRVEGGL